MTVAASQFDDAGKGGSVTLEAGAYEGSSPASSTAELDLSGQIDLSVAGSTGGTLLLEAPQVSGAPYVAGSSYTPVAVNAAGGGTPVDIAVAPIAPGVVTNASRVVVAGVYVQDAQAANAFLDGFEASAQSNVTSFAGNASTIENRIFGSQPANVHLRPGEEIDNSVGNFELQTTWDLSTLRAGHEPGLLTIRAAGNLNIDFGASLTDGFDSIGGVNYTNPLLPTGSQSWSYQLVTGADFGAANLGSVQTVTQLQVSGLGGTLQVGYQNAFSPIVLSNANVNDVNTFFQAIRTGTGDITIDTGGDLLLMNNLASIYTAGSQVDPTLNGSFTAPTGTNTLGSVIPATYSQGGGNVLITAQGNIAHETYQTGNTVVADSSAELPTSWLDREGAVNGSQITTPTTWWVDFTNFFEGVGALGGGNVTLSAGGSVVNVDAVVPTNARLVNGTLTELGGGDLAVHSGNNIDGGVYYVERGQGSLVAQNDITTNSTRGAVAIGQLPNSLDFLPTTMFLGKGSFSVAAGGDLLLGPVANPFLLPQSYNNEVSHMADTTSELSYFSTYASTDAVNALSLAGNATIRDFADGGQGSLYAWYTNLLDGINNSTVLGNQVSDSEPWLLLAEATSVGNIGTDFGSKVRTLGAPANVYGGVTAILPPTLRVTSFSGDIDLVGTLTLSPSATGTVDLVAAGSLHAFQTNEIDNTGAFFYGSGLIDLSDADPGALPGIDAPLSAGSQLTSLAPLFTETGATEGLVLQVKEALHADIDGQTLHANDPTPAYIFAGGDISGLTFFSAKQAQVLAKTDITDVGLYLQNNQPGDISLVSAGRDLVAYDASSPLRLQAGANLQGNAVSTLGSGAGAPNSGDIQISGPGTLEVLSGRQLTLGNDAGENFNNSSFGDGLFTGITSVGGQLNPTLPFDGANIVAAAGLGAALPSGGYLEQSSLPFSAFINQFLNPTSAFASTYLPDIAPALGLTGAGNSQIWNSFENLSAGRQDLLALDAFYLVLRDAGRNHNDPNSPDFGTYTTAYEALDTLFPTHDTFKGDLNITSREIKTSNGGDINLLTPGGQILVGVNSNAANAGAAFNDKTYLAPNGTLFQATTQTSTSNSASKTVDQGILTVDQGNISIFASSNVTVGTSRIFTLNGGNEVIWSTEGNIGAGASSKTVVSAPPTRVIIDPTSGEVELDLAGLNTGGGIGTLQTTAVGRVSDVDLIAPAGIVDAGDAGIRATGNLNISALKVLNADNISVGGKSTGVPVSASINVGAIAGASAATGSSEAAASNTTPNRQNVADNTQDVPSIISVEVLGYGGGDQD